MLSIVYIYTGNLLNTISVHTLLNITKFIPFDTYNFVKGFAIANVPHSIACAVITVIGMVYFFGYFRPRYITRKYDPELEIISL